MDSPHVITKKVTELTALEYYNVVLDYDQLQKADELLSESGEKLDHQQILDAFYLLLRNGKLDLASKYQARFNIELQDNIENLNFLCPAVQSDNIELLEWLFDNMKYGIGFTYKPLPIFTNYVGIFQDPLHFLIAIALNVNSFNSVCWLLTLDPDRILWKHLESVLVKCIISNHLVWLNIFLQYIEKIPRHYRKLKNGVARLYTTAVTYRAIVSADYLRRKYQIDPLDPVLDLTQIRYRKYPISLGTRVPFLYFADDSRSVFRWFLRITEIKPDHILLGQAIYLGARRIISYILETTPEVNRKLAIDYTFSYVVRNRGGEDNYAIERDECVREVILSDLPTRQHPVTLKIKQE